MSLNSINRCLTNNTLWVLFSFSILALYLSPLVINDGVFYVPYFDNLDSNVVWYKILAESGMIFADNNAIIPNMMNGLPRASYPSEFDMILWLYYFFSPQTAYVINEILIHMVAFFSMYIFLEKYIVKEKKYYNNVPIFVGALYFSLIPYWSGTGLTIAILPLVTYSLLNIKNRITSKFDWLLLLFLPLYSSFIFTYMYYIIMAGIYMTWDAIKNRKLNRPFFFALVLMGTAFLLSEYRLVLAMFSDSGFISHRTEFKIFFTDDLLDTYRKVLTFFLNGHSSHIPGLQVFYVLPLILIGILLSFAKRRFNAQESMIIWLLIAVSFMFEIWKTLLTQLYTLPIISLLTFFLIFISKQNKTYGLILLFQIILAIFAGSIYYEGLHGVTEVFPILEKLNLTRAAFIQPFIWTILLVMALLILIKKLHFSLIFILIFMVLQIFTSFYYSYYQSKPIQRFASFQDYYAPKLFNKIKKSIPEEIDTIRVISYGLEPAVLQFNGFYTLGGYTVNYPLSYKYQFRNIIAEYLDINNSVSKHARNIYDDWGSKLYILETTITLEYYSKNLLVKKPSFNSNALCNLGTDYLISSFKFEKPEEKDLIFIKSFKGKTNSWDIYLYKLECD